jgi:hypothetical protein
LAEAKAGAKTIPHREVMRRLNAQAKELSGRRPKKKGKGQATKA